MVDRQRIPGRRAAESGFTISELVAVLLVFGALVTITIVSLSGIRSDHSSTDCDTQLRTLKAATAQYEAQYGVPAPNLASLSKVGLKDIQSIDGWTYTPGAEGEDPVFEPARSECG